MKKSLLLFILVSYAVTASAGIIKPRAQRSGAPMSRAAVTIPTSVTKCLTASYDPTEDDVAEFYLIFSDKLDASWSKEDGPQVKDGFALRLDIYAPTSSPIVLPDGTYTASSDYTAMTYDPDYSYVEYYDANGVMSSTVYDLSGGISITRAEDGTYTVKANVKNGSTVTEVVYNGAITFDDGSLPPSIYNQIGRNLNLEFNGALANYDGNLYESNTGAMYINLYDHAFNPETGGMLEDGFSIALQVFGKLFANSKEATLDPGTYTVARNFKRFTFFPGLEVDYMGTTVILGSYAKERNPSLYVDGFGYSYLTDGTVVIEDMGDKVFRITIDAVTSQGHQVKGTFEGKVPVNDQSDDKGGTALSTLEDDVTLDLEQIPVCRAYNNGVTNGCQRFIVDIGSPSGKDGNTEGDILRMEFLLAEGTPILSEGTYTVVDEKLDTSMEPFKLTKGYFAATSTGGTDLSGTRYMHFEAGRTLIMDHYAPADAGSVGVKKNADDTYTFTINLIDDAQFRIDGSWTGPMILMYDPNSFGAVDDVLADSNEAISVEWIDTSTLLIGGTQSAAGAKVFDVYGRLMNCRVNGIMVDMSGVSAGIYVLNLNGKSIKVVKK